jgi:PadR family transcriptional regulator PadR
MKSQTSLGDLEFHVMLATLGLGENAYGVTIYEELEKAGRKTSLGAIYTTLGRLEDKGLISSRRGEATAERGGRAKRYFKVEALGSKALRETEASMRKLRDLLPDSVR